MGEFPRKADGRRIFTPEFKREVVQQIVKGEKSLAERGREFDVTPTAIRTWMRRSEVGAATAVKANGEVVAASELASAQARIRELERALGRKTMEVARHAEPGRPPGSSSAALPECAVNLGPLQGPAVC